ncbi:MAG: hypothetical protein M2R45_02598 [Verrucomicrobia subdivision 3 bacterium]|nr:hypothetical protein [Limisphaerales bacterium]
MTITVTGEGALTDPPVFSVPSMNNGNLEVTITGSPGATASVMRISIIGGAASEVGTVTFDADGQAVFTLPMDGPTGFFFVR